MFKEFKLTDVLNVERANCIPSKENLTDGDIPYVTRSAVNNGKTRTCGNIEKINRGNCISVGGEGGAVFYQPEDWVAGNNMCRLWRDGLTEEHYLYIVGVMDKITNVYSYSNARTQEKIKKETLYLPIIESPNPYHKYTVDDIDWQYMRDRITELERDRITELERDRITELDAYLQATGLDDYELTEEDKQVLSLSAKATSDKDGNLEDTGEKILEKRDRQDEVRFGKFKIGDLFKIATGRDVIIGNTESGQYPLVSHQNTENGITKYIAKLENRRLFNHTKTISLADRGMFWATIQDEDFYIGTRVKALVWNYPHEIQKTHLLYIVGAINQLQSLFSEYLTNATNKLPNLEIALPIASDGEPDFDYMERYIRAMEKVVIADVVKYKDKVIEATKEVVSA